jgi:hypothetical protein
MFAGTTEYQTKYDEYLKQDDDKRNILRQNNAMERIMV